MALRKINPRLFPWLYLGVCVIVVFLYLGASLNFVEKVGTLDVYSVRGKLFMGSSALRALRISNDPLTLNFSWTSPIWIEMDQNVKKKVIPLSYTVDKQGLLSLQLPYESTLVFSSSPQSLEISAQIPQQYKLSLEWQLDSAYDLRKEGAGLFLLDKESGDVVYEVVSSLGRTEINSDGLVLSGADTILIRPYGVGKLTFDEWVVSKSNVDKSSFDGILEGFVDEAVAELKDSQKNTTNLTQQEQLALLVLSASSKTHSAQYSQMIKAIKPQTNNRNFGLSFLLGSNSATIFPLYQATAESIKDRIFDLSGRNDRGVYAIDNLADYLINHRFSVSHQRLVQRTESGISALDNPVLVNQVAFLAESQIIRQTQLKEGLIAKHLDVILPSLISAYHGLYVPISRNEDASDVFDTLSAIRLAKTLLALDAAQLSVGKYAQYYRTIGYKLFETVFLQFKNEGKIPKTVSLADTLTTSEEVLPLPTLVQYLWPNLWPREFSEATQKPSDYYVFTSAENLSIQSSTSAIRVTLDNPFGIEKNLMLFRVGNVSAVSINNKAIAQSKTASYAANQWYFDRSNNILYIKAQTREEKAVIDVSLVSGGQVPVEPASTPQPAATPQPAPAPTPQPAATPAPAPQEKESSDEEPKLTEKEKRDLEKKRKEEERKQKQEEEKKRKDEERRKAEAERKKPEEDKKESKK